MPEHEGKGAGLAAHGSASPREQAPPSARPSAQSVEAARPEQPEQPGRAATDALDPGERRRALLVYGTAGNPVRTGGRDGSA